MKAIPMKGILTAWGRILLGKAPSLSIEITRECPLQCPGCYAYGDDHLNGDTTLRQLRDFKGQELVERVLALVDQHRPLHVSIVGGEPLVRYRELGDILPALAARDIYVQLVTSAVREIPREWHALPKLTIVVSIDGLQPEHDARRAPATYSRILRHIEGHEITVHCTVTRQQAVRPGYLEEFVRFWSDRHESGTDLDEPVYAAGRRGVRGAPAADRSRTRRERPDGAPAALPEAADQRGDAGRLPGAADAHPTSASSPARPRRSQRT